MIQVFDQNSSWPPPCGGIQTTSKRKRPWAEPEHAREIIYWPGMPQEEDLVVTKLSLFPHWPRAGKETENGWNGLMLLLWLCFHAEYLGENCVFQLQLPLSLNRKIKRRRNPCTKTKCPECPEQHWADDPRCVIFSGTFTSQITDMAGSHKLALKFMQMSGGHQVRQSCTK